MTITPDTKGLLTSTLPGDQPLAQRIAAAVLSGVSLPANHEDFEKMAARIVAARQELAQVMQTALEPEKR